MSEKLSYNLLDVPLGVPLLLFLDFIPKQLIIATCKSMRVRKPEGIAWNEEYWATQEGPSRKQLIARSKKLLIKLQNLLLARLLQR